MATTIRLSRGGAKKRPYYRIVVTNSRSPRDCGFIEKIGTYNPLLANDNPQRVTINKERAQYWVSVGAQISDRVQHFFHKEGLINQAPKQKVARRPRKAPKEEAAPAAATPAAEAPATESAA